MSVLTRLLSLRRSLVADGLLVTAAVGGAGIVVLATTWVVAGGSKAVGWVTGDAVSEGAVALGVVGVAVVALLVWLDTDAVRDLARARHHVQLDVGRIAATVVALGTASTS